MIQLRTANYHYEPSSLTADIFVDSTVKISSKRTYRRYERRILVHQECEGKVHRPSTYLILQYEETMYDYVQLELKKRNA